MPEIKWTAAREPARATLVLAHAAGVGMDAPFMSRIAENTAGEGVAVARFEFAYMAARRSGGPKRPPPRADALIAEFSAALKAVLAACDGAVLIGGKSMGGRVAAMLSGENLDRRVRGVVCLGYPFHPTGKPDQWRLEPLQAARLPVLIAQGERDPFGNRDEVTAVSLPDRVRFVWLVDGDHDLKPRAKAAADWGGNLSLTAAAIAEFAGQTVPD